MSYKPISKIICPAVWKKKHLASYLDLPPLPSAHTRETRGGTVGHAERTCRRRMTVNEWNAPSLLFPVFHGVPAATESRALWCAWHVGGNQTLVQAHTLTLPANWTRPRCSAANGVGVWLKERGFVRVCSASRQTVTAMCRRMCCSQCHPRQTAATHCPTFVLDPNRCCWSKRTPLSLGLGACGHPEPP